MTYFVFSASVLCLIVNVYVYSINEVIVIVTDRYINCYL